MSFRIDRLIGGDESLILRVSGRIHAENLDTLRDVLGRQNGRIVIDLEEVALVDREAVAFLALSEIDGIELRNCPAYIREWIDREKRSE
jgi:anti-anti-sigma regulatory factor